MSDSGVLVPISQELWDDIAPSQAMMKQVFTEAARAFAEAFEDREYERIHGPQLRPTRREYNTIMEPTWRAQRRRRNIIRNVMRPGRHFGAFVRAGAYEETQ